MNYWKIGRLHTQENVERVDGMQGVVPRRFVATAFIQLTKSSHSSDMLTEEYLTDTVIF